MLGFAPALLASFQELRHQIELTGKYAVPQNPRVTVGQHPTLTALIIPNNQEAGTLESMLLRAVTPHEILTPCLDAYFTCCGFSKLPITVASKKMLTTIIAARNDNNPSCSLAFIWSAEQALYNPISIDHPSIVDLLEFLRQFAQPQN